MAVNKINNPRSHIGKGRQRGGGGGGKGLLDHAAFKSRLNVPRLRLKLSRR